MSDDKKSFEIKFAAGNKVWGDKAVGAPFNIYARGTCLHYKENGQTFENVRTWAYGLTADDSLSDNWPIHEFEDKNYHLRIYGPNGFFRQFKGNAEDPQLRIDFPYQSALTNSKKLTGTVQVTITNLSRKPQIVAITDHAYKTTNCKKMVSATSKATLVLDLQNSHSWYDFGIKVAGHNTFEKRYAGRVETGRQGYTDPLMGGVVA